MQFMLRTFWPVVALVAIVIAGCSPSTEQVIGGKSRPKEYKAVVSLSPSTTELFGSMIKYEVLKGRTSSCNWPPEIKLVPVVAGVKPDYEKIAAIKPDLIVYDKSLYSDADVAKIKQICPDTWVLDADTLSDFKRQIIEFAAMTGGETNMSSYVDKIYYAEHAAGDYKPNPKPKCALIMPGKGTEHMIDGTDSFQADVIRTCGGEPVGPKGKVFVPLSPETLTSENPDFIITAGDPADFLKDSRFANLKAVKENHVFGILADIVLRRGGRVNVFIAGVSNILQGKVHG